MTIDFKEIPKANSSSGNQDTFELFARDFLKESGYRIINTPSRGADGGIDFAVEETRVGPSRIPTKFRWLVSCKHYAHSGRAINSEIESDIVDRVIANNCNGFIGFYSTLPSSGLQSKLDGLADQVQVLIYDSRSIESDIIGFGTWFNIFRRYFPKSYKAWSAGISQNEPIKLFEYFFDSKQKTSDFQIRPLKAIYGTSEHILLALKRTSSYSDFISYAGQRYVVEDTVKIMDKLFEQSAEELRNRTDLNNHDIIKLIEGEKFSDYLSRKFQIYDLGIQRMRGTALLEETCKYYLYKNLLCVNEPMDSLLQTLYTELISILKE